MRTMRYFSKTALFLVMSWTCVGLMGAVTTRAGIELMPSENRFNYFDAEILQSVANTKAGNVVVSPIGIKTVLGMLLEGAGGRSADQIRTALRVPERQDAIRRVFENYISKIREPTTGIKLEIGSSVFMAKNLVPSHEYASNLNHYYANLVKVDFENPELTARNINNWIRDVTRGLIPKLVDPGNLHPDSQVLVTNAIYFKGKWKIPFEQEATKVRCFYKAPGVCHNTNMMDTLEFFKFNYIQELNADALELPYEGEKFSMLILAPKEIDGVAQLQRDLSHFPVHSIVEALETTEVLVSLPRFEIEFSTDLVPNLHNLGIQDIFGPNSNLTGMFERNENTVQVSNVFHKTKIIVNEAGSEAAAGTGALVVPLMGSSAAKFRADRPFLFFIRDVTKGITLFAGRVSIPETATAIPQYQRPRPQPSTAAPVHSESSEDGTYGDIFTSTQKPSHSNQAGVQIFRPVATRRPTPRPVATVSLQTRPSEGTHNSFLNRNNNTLGSSQDSGFLFSNTGNQNKPQQSTSQNTNSQNSFSQQESRPSNENFNYPQNVPQSNDREIILPSFLQQNPPIIQQTQQGILYEQTYRPLNNIPSNAQNAPQPQFTSQNRPNPNQNIGQYSQHTDRQVNVRDSTLQVLQPPREYYNSPTLTHFQSGNQPSYSQPHLAGTYATSQQGSSQQSQTGVRSENPQGQTYETTVRQSPSRVEDQIFFQTQRSAHSSSNL